MDQTENNTNNPLPVQGQQQQLPISTSNWTIPIQNNEQIAPPVMLVNSNANIQALAPSNSYTVITPSGQIIRTSTDMLLASLLQIMNMNVPFGAVAPQVPIQFPPLQQTIPVQIPTLTATGQTVYQIVNLPINASPMLGSLGQAQIVHQSPYSLISTPSQMARVISPSQILPVQQAHNSASLVGQGSAMQTSQPAPVIIQSSQIQPMDYSPSNVSLISQDEPMQTSPPSTSSAGSDALTTTTAVSENDELLQTSPPSTSSAGSDALTTTTAVSENDLLPPAGDVSCMSNTVAKTVSASRRAAVKLVQTVTEPRVSHHVLPALAPTRPRPLRPKKIILPNVTNTTTQSPNLPNPETIPDTSRVLLPTSHVFNLPGAGLCQIMLPAPQHSNPVNISQNLSQNVQVVDPTVQQTVPGALYEIRRIV